MAQLCLILNPKPNAPFLIGSDLRLKSAPTCKVHLILLVIKCKFLNLDKGNQIEFLPLLLAQIMPSFSLKAWKYSINIS